VGIDPPRWASHYWGLPITRVTLPALAGARPDDLVVILVGRVPEWFPTDYERRLVAREGDYGLIRVADILPADSPVARVGPFTGVETLEVDKDPAGRSPGRGRRAPTERLPPTPGPHVQGTAA